MTPKAQRILQLIGSTAMIALNSNNVSARDNGLSFKFRGSKKGNFLKIEYVDEALQINLYRVSSNLVKEKTLNNIAEQDLHLTLQNLLGIKLPAPASND